MNLERYLRGDLTQEDAAINELRCVGEAAARRAGMQTRDVDELGVDFASFILTERIAVIRTLEGDRDAYLRRSAHWFITHERRRTWRRETVLLGHPERSASYAALGRDEDVADAVLRRDLMERLERAVAQLPQGEQRLYQIFIAEGCNCTEAAARLECNPAAARKRLERLRRHVRMLLGAAV